MKKHLFTAAMALVMGTSLAQTFLDHPSYRGAFEPAPTTSWTDGWTNWDPQNKVYPANTMTITSTSGSLNAVATITSNVTWHASDVVYLNGPIFVQNATVTIEAGCVVKGAPGNGTGLFICPGAKLIANGTVNNPIVFTSNSDPQFRHAGDWGGVILMGKASCNAPASNTANVIGSAPVPVAGTNYLEGMPSSALTLYGGGSNPCDDDNSGSMKYCRIEFAGYVYAPNKEINSLTFGAVGYGTTIDYIQCSYGNDDSYEWFGGSVRCKHLISYAPVDDDFDTDNGFHGIVQYGLSVRHPNIYDPTWSATGGSVSEGFESDNDPEDLTVGGYAAGQPHAQTAAIFANCTMVGPRGLASAMSMSVGAGFQRGARIRRNSSLRVVNSILVDHATNGMMTDGGHSTDNAVNGCLVFKNNIVAGYGGVAIQTNNGGTAGTWTVTPTQTHWIGNANDTSKANTGASYLTNPYVAFTGVPDFRPIGIATSGADWTNVHIAGEDVTSPCDQSTYSALTPYTATCTAIPVTTTSIRANNTLIGSVSLYPNPSSDASVLNITTDHEITLSVAVYDVTGKLVATPAKNETLVSGTASYSINTSVMNNGIYFVTVSTTNGKETVKLIVNK